MNVEYPSWIYEVNDKSHLSSADVVQCFHFTNLKEFHKTLKRGDFPLPDQRHKCGKLFWLVSTIKREIARRKILASQ